MTTLENMTAERWALLSETDRAGLRDLSGLTPQLVGLEGWRVEVDTTYGETRQFIVGRSTGWRPCHTELPRRDSSGGFAADSEYVAVRRLYQARR